MMPAEISIRFYGADLKVGCPRRPIVLDRDARQGAKRIEKAFNLL